MTLYLIRGIPGAGKTTFADELSIFASHFYDTPVHCFEADDYFYDIEGNYNYDPSKIKEAHEECFRQTKFLLTEGRDVIVSNTLTTEWEVAKYEELAKELNVKLVSLIALNLLVLATH